MLTHKPQSLAVKCPSCGTIAAEPLKEWYYGPKGDPKRFTVRSYSCSRGHRFLAWVRPSKVTVRLLRESKRKLHSTSR